MCRGRRAEVGAVHRELFARLWEGRIGVLVRHGCASVKLKGRGWEENVRSCQVRALPMPMQVTCSAFPPAQWLCLRLKACCTHLHRALVHLDQLPKRAELIAGQQSVHVADHPAGAVAWWRRRIAGGRQHSYTVLRFEHLRKGCVCGEGGLQWRGGGGGGWVKAMIMVLLTGGGFADCV